MEQIIQQIAGEISKNFETELRKMIIEGRDISQFILATKKMLDGVGVKLTAEALEIMDQAFRESNDRKKRWVVKSKADQKALTTIFGEVSYKRTYYKNKKTGEYSYLSDEAVGIQPHDKLDTSLKARLIEEAISTPYKRSGEKAAEAVKLTSQTVMNSIRELGAVSNESVKIKEKKRHVKILYIEADEDHVALQNGRCIEPKLVYVHEGRKKIGQNRWKLENPRYFSGVYVNSDLIWGEVADYIDEAYDASTIEKMYLSGDGAAWIKNGVGWIKGSTYVLDRYHLSKYVNTATAHMSHTTTLMWRYINEGNKKRLVDLFTAIINGTETDTKRESVKDAKKYIMRNWTGVKNYYDKDYYGCSAEGHISHILSSRLSSRPLGWCSTGVDQMARLRAYEANGGLVYELMMERKKSAKLEAKNLRIDQEINRKRNLVNSHETTGNLTALNMGKRTWLSEYLKSVRDA